jgi:hypothetical protein
MREGELRCVGQVESTFYLRRRAWPVFVTPQNLRLARQLESEAARPLETLVRITRGATIDGLPKLAAAGRACGDAVSIVRGRDIQRYGALAQRPLWRVSRDALPEAARKCILTHPTAVLQNIGDRVKATLCPAGHLPMDTVNVLEGPDLGLACYLVAYLNSAAIGRYVRDFILNRATMTVHFDAPTIGGLPVRMPGAAELYWFERHVPMLIEERDAELEREAEARVQEACGLTDETPWSVRDES